MCVSSWMQTIEHLIANWTLVLKNISNYNLQECVIFCEHEIYTGDQFSIGITCSSAVAPWAAQANDSGLACELAAVNTMGHVFPD